MLEKYINIIDSIVQGNISTYFELWSLISVLFLFSYNIVNILQFNIISLIL